MSQPLRDRIVAPAGLPDDSDGAAECLVEIAVLSAARVGVIDYASVTSGYPGAYHTVAASSENAVAIDEAQYADGLGPCLDALRAGQPTGVPSIATTMAWPGFRTAAVRMGLRASLSLPLCAGRGLAIAALNLYAYEPEPLRPLIAAAQRLYQADVAQWDTAAPAGEPLGAGAAELISGLTGAFATQATIQQSIGILMVIHDQSSGQAYLELRRRAAGAGIGLAGVAAALIHDHQR